MPRILRSDCPPIPATARDPSCTRRAFSAGVGAALGGLALGRPARANDNGLSILIAGDSMVAGGFGIFLARALSGDHEVRRRGKSSTGLARPDFFNWMDEAHDLVSDGPADVSIVMFGGNDVQGLYMGRDEKRKREWIRWPDPGWSQEYARRVVEFSEILGPAGQHIVWVGLPIMRPDKFRARCGKVNTIYRAEMAIRPNSWFIDTWRLLADDDGNYADKVVLEPAPQGRRAKRVRVRAGDGIHLSPAGAQHVTDFVLGRLQPILEKAGALRHP